MKMLRVVLHLLLAPMCLLSYDLFTALYEWIAKPVRHNMLGFGLSVHFAGFFFVVLLPLCVLLGYMWWNDRRRYLFDVLLLIGLTIFIVPIWSSHPYRTLLFLTCCWIALPGRVLIDHFTIRK